VPQRQAQLSRSVDLPQNADALLEQRRLLLVGELAMLGDDRGPIQRPPRPTDTTPGRRATACTSQAKPSRL
jgi:hypothetical protein